MNTSGSQGDANNIQIVNRFVKSLIGYKGKNDFDASFLLGIGEKKLLVNIVNGELVRSTDMKDIKPLVSYDFSIKADVDTWCDFWQVIPKAGDHDIFALAKSKRMKIEGNLLILMQHLQFFKDLLALGRKGAV